MRNAAAPSVVDNFKLNAAHDLVLCEHLRLAEGAKVSLTENAAHFGGVGLV
jgi:hypothetical protein